jgi:hypothetical protein
VLRYRERDTTGRLGGVRPRNLLSPSPSPAALLGAPRLGQLDLDPPVRGLHGLRLLRYDHQGLFVLNPKVKTRRPKTGTLKPKKKQKSENRKLAPETRRSETGTRNPKLETETRNPKPETLHPKPQTSNTKPQTQTLNPKPSDSELGSAGRAPLLHPPRPRGLALISCKARN